MSLGLFGAQAEEWKAGAVNRVTFTGPITEKEISYNIYLPEGYDEDGSRYSVIYHLHGLDCDEYEGNEALTGALERAVQEGISEPMIIVFPRGFPYAFWADSKDGKMPGETQIIQELIPHIDRTYRTVGDRDHRVISGMSMGGFGALLYGMKYPDLFRVCVNYDGAPLTWEQLMAGHPSEPSLSKTPVEIFANDEAYFNAFSPWHNASKNAEQIRGRIDFITLVGSLGHLNGPFRDHMKELDLAVDYVQTQCEHDLECIAEEQGNRIFAFIAERLWKRGR
jgi:S-formylglutathione hydrolase FrmB